MKRALAFVLLAVVIDFCTGATLSRLYRRTLTGERGGLTNYALTRDADVLILGSSRAQMHFMPSVIGPGLSMKAYNAGLKGYDFLYSVMLYDLWKHRHPAPKAIVLQIDVESLLRRESELAGAQIFAPYMDESELVREVLFRDGPYKRLAYLSRAYRYNGKVFSIAKNLMRKPPPGFDGYALALGTPDPAGPFYNAMDQDQTALEQAEREPWDFKLAKLRELADDCARSGTHLYLVHTPIHGLDPRAHLIWSTKIRRLVATLPSTTFLDLCEEGVPREFGNWQDLYANSNHLNPQGAEVLSKLLVDRVSKELQEPLASPPTKSVPAGGVQSARSDH
jgi:hypothetical protein